MEVEVQLLELNMENADKVQDGVLCDLTHLLAPIWVETYVQYACGNLFDGEHMHRGSSCSVPSQGC